MQDTLYTVNANTETEQIEIILKHNQFSIYTLSDTKSLLAVHTQVTEQQDLILKML